MNTRALLASCLLLVSLMAAQSQRRPAPKEIVSLVSATPVTVAGRPGKLQLRFRVADEFHINSNKPNNEMMIPTVLKLDVPTDLVVARLKYPAGKDLVFDFAPDEKLSVYDGEFDVTGMVTATGSATPGTYRLRGVLKYQACNDRQCFPPKETPFQFDVTVGKRAGSARRNPGQSPHVHR